MFKDLLARFKSVLTVAEWKKAAQEAIQEKEFVIDSLRILHEVEKSDATGRTQQRSPMGQQMGMGQQMSMGAGAVPGQYMPPTMPPIGGSAAQRQAALRQFDEDEREKIKKRSEMSLADLMNQIKQQQQMT